MSSTLKYVTASGRTVTIPVQNEVFHRPHRYEDFDQWDQRAACHACNGEGAITTPENLTEPCWHCEGSGKEPVDA